jgi:Flp pilus assembly pilin Flp
MLRALRSRWRELLRSEAGPTTIEYAVMLVLMVLGMMAALEAFRDDLDSFFRTAIADIT